jgi:hypothetical protein
MICYLGLFLILSIWGLIFYFALVWKGSGHTESGVRIELEVDSENDMEFYDYKPRDINPELLNTKYEENKLFKTKLRSNLNREYLDYDFKTSIRRNYNRFKLR